MPRVWKALSEGEIDLRRARVILFWTAHLAEEAARAVVDRVIGRASQLTSGQLHALIRRLIIQADPEMAEGPMARECRIGG
jgi:hypothetical protein